MKAFEKINGNQGQVIVIDPNIGLCSYGILPPPAIKAFHSTLSIKGRKLRNMLLGKDGPLNPHTVIDYVKNAGWGDVRWFTDDEIARISQMALTPHRLADMHAGKPCDWIPQGTILIRVQPDQIVQAGDK